MKEQMSVNYDEEGDFLEINIGSKSECYAEEIEPGVFIRKDERTDEIKGIGIIDFKKRSKSLKDIGLALPFKIEVSIA